MPKNNCVELIVKDKTIIKARKTFAKVYDLVNLPPLINPVLERLVSVTNTYTHTKSTTTGYNK